eukprot:gb/GECH01002248.1/.p1 GENE.gb/GECH01002248.1/~~gb/GECH01002248.1/.p1  ORF type:complete len:465 (+),score=101.37 gb/GECH01002248.1/:1-1395(+)
MSDSSSSLSSSSDSVATFGTSVTVIASIVVFSLIFTTIVGCILVLWRRKFQPVKARNPWLTVACVSSVGTCVAVFTLRYAVGMGIFPCFITVFSSIMVAPGILFPLILRCWRIYFLQKLGTFKQKLRVTPNDKKLFRTLANWKLLISTRFLLTVFAIHMSLHMLLALIMVVALGDFRTAQGCTAIFAAPGFTGIALFVLHLAVLFVALFLIRRVRDIFHIQREIFIMKFGWLISVVLWIAFQFIPPYQDHVEYHFPAGMFPLIFASIDIIMTGIVPPIQSVSQERKNRAYMLAYEGSRGSPSAGSAPREDLDPSEELDQAFEDPKLLELLLNFSMRAFASENVHFVIDYKGYLKLWNSASSSYGEEAVEELEEISTAMGEKYVNPESPLLLNIEDADEYYEEILQKKDQPEDLYNLWNDIYQQVKLNLTDTFMQFTTTKEYQQAISDIKDEKEAEKLRQELGSK